MSINVGDAVLTLLGDSTQLDETFNKVGTEAPAKLAPAVQAADKVGQSLEGAGAKGQIAGQQIAGVGVAAQKMGLQGTEAGNGVAVAYERLAVASQQVQEAQFRVALVMNTIKQNALQDAEATGALAQAQQQAAQAALQYAVAQKAATVATEGVKVNMRDAKGEVGLLGEAIGVGIPRHVRNFIAELPGVATALEAAFAVTAVFFLISILIQAIEKLQEWRKEGELLRQQWITLDTTFHNTSSSIQEQIDQQKQKFIELTQGPVAGLEFALEHMRSTADDVLGKIISEVDATGQAFEKNKHFWNEWGDASESVKKFGADLQDTMHKASAATPGDQTAAYRAGLKLTGEEIDKVNTELAKIAEQSARFAKESDTGATAAQVEAANFGEQVEVLKKKLEILTRINEQLKQGQQLDTGKSEADKAAEAAAVVQRVLELGNAEITARKTTGDALRALRAEQAREDLEQGKVTNAQEIGILKQLEDEKYQATREGLLKRRGLEQADPTKNAAALKQTNGELEALETQHQTALLQLDFQSWKQRATDFSNGMQVLISGAKQGSQERIDLEEGLTEFYRQTYGEQSEIYQAELRKLEVARVQHKEVIKRVALEEAQAEQALAVDRIQADQQMWAYLVQTARMGATQAAALARQSEIEILQTRRDSLAKQIQQLGPEELEARAKLNGQLRLLDQQLEEKRRLDALHAGDAQTSYLKELGVTSDQTYSDLARLAEEAYDKAAKAGKLSAAEEIKARKAVLEAERDAAQARGESTQQYDIALQKLDNRWTQLTGGVRSNSRELDTWHKIAQKDFDGVADAMQHLVLRAKAALDLVSNSLQTAIESAILGNDTFTDALRKALAQQLAAWAAQDAIAAIRYTALGFARLAEQRYDLAGQAFTAAAIYATVAAAEGIAAYALNPKTPEDKQQAPQTEAAAGIEQGPTQQQNAPQRLAGGGIYAGASNSSGRLFSGPTMVMLGDAVGNPSSSQGQEEAAIPLENPDALDKVGSAIGAHIAGGRGGIVVHVDGMISPDNLIAVIKKINRAVERNDVKLTASKAFKVTSKTGRQG